MSGHSKWKTIKSQKESTDKQRGNLFSKISRAISIAARENANPDTNFKLRLAIEQAKEANMPKDNVERAIRKGSGEIEGASWEEISYEGYGPEGVAVIVEAVTDNKNRTTAEIKNLFERGGGTLAGPGAVQFQFKRLGLINVERSGEVDNQILKIIDLGVEEVEEVADSIEVSVPPAELQIAKEKIEAAGFKILRTEISMEPVVLVKIEDSDKAQRIIKFMDNLEEHDDVQRVYANFDIPDEVIGKG